MPRVEIIEFNGVVFRRYPDSPIRTDRVYFTPKSSLRKQGMGRLHQEIWKAAYGEIPEGGHIHHRDGDPLNNSLENLECLDPRAHHHADALRGVYKTGPRKAHLDRIRPLAGNWHQSKEGREWHRKNPIRKEPRQFTCEQCGTRFECIDTGNNRFCSGNCKAKWRKLAGLDSEERSCVWCGESFMVNRYSRARACSASCGQRARRATDLVEITCEECGIRIKVHATGKNRWCSRLCHSAWRRRMGRDDEERTCEECGARFAVRRDQSTRYCGRLCSRHAQRTGGAPSL
jgi:hypothetical protein